MAGDRIDNFGGVIPRLGSRQLPKNGAQLATNAKLYSQELRSFAAAPLVFTSSRTTSIKTAYRMYSGAQDFWLTWGDDVDVAKAPVAGDTTFRVYYTGDSVGGGRPKKTNFTLATSSTDYPHDYLELGVLKPPAPTLGAISGGVGAAVTQAYVITYVTAWNEEGPPSDPVTGTGKIDSTTWPVNLPTAVVGKYSIASINIYRSITGASGLTNYYFIATVALGTPTFNDNHANVPDSLVVLRGTIPTYTFGLVNSEWSAPDATMVGLASGPNGMMAGFFGKTVCFCEPYFPHGWPVRYQYLVPWDVVYIGWFGASLVIATKGRPYIMSGTHPSSMSQVQVERDDMPCSSKRSGAGFSFGVTWAVPNGMALVGAGSPLIVTEEHMTRDEWRALCFPDTLFAKVYQDRYFGFFNDGTQLSGFIFDRPAKERALVFFDTDATGVYTDAETSKLYILNNAGVYEWDASTTDNLNFNWLSRTFVYPNLVNFSCYQVDADYSVLGGVFEETQEQIAADLATNTAILAATTQNWPGTAGQIKGEIGSHMLGGYQQIDGFDPLRDGPLGSHAYGIMLGGSLLVGGTYTTFAGRSLLFQAYAYNYETSVMELVHSESVTDGRPRRLPSGYKSDTWEVRLNGNIFVRSVRWAQMMRELKGL